MRFRIGLIMVGCLAVLGGAGPAAAGQGDIITFSEMCDASGAVFTLGGAVLVADDRSDVLLTYRATGGAPVGRTDLYDLTGTPRHSRRNYSAFEGAARLGDKIFFISSHSREEKGKNRPNRRRLLAVQSTKIGDVEKIEPVGSAYTGLNADFSESPGLRSLGLANAIMQLHRQLPHLAPDKQGINVEGLAAGKEGGLLIGLRNPRPRGQTIVIPLANPDRVVMGSGEPEFGPPIRLDLGGLGISDMALHPTQGVYYIVATPHDADGGAKLFRWSGASDEPPTALGEIGPADFSAQAVAVSPDGKRLMVLSDDGDRPMEVADKEGCKVRHAGAEGCACHDLADASRKQFRGQWIDVPPLPAADPVTAKP